MLNWDLFGDDKSTEFLAQYTADQLKIRIDEVYAALEWKSSSDASSVTSTNCEAPGHTDLMVTPESIDAWLEKNPLPECTCGGEADQPAVHHDISCPLAVSPAHREGGAS
jgi:hypothetical protein